MSVPLSELGWCQTGTLGQPDEGQGYGAYPLRQEHIYLPILFGFREIPARRYA